jgi:hypothetical protein
MSTRPLSDAEQTFLEALLSVPDPHIQHVREQLPHTRVESGASLPNHRWLHLVVDTSACDPCAYPFRVIVEADGDDASGKFDLLVFLSDEGYLAGVEGYRVETGADLDSLPPPESIRAKLWTPKAGI